jgi:hypothetical protein
MITDLSPVKSVAVGLIALLAGCELNLRALAPRLRQIGLLSFAGLFERFFVLIGAMIFGILHQLPMGEGLTTSIALMIVDASARTCSARSRPLWSSAS